jgi:hypothetical protein
MASCEDLAAMLLRSPSLLSKVSQAGQKVRETSCFDVDTKSVPGKEREKGFFKIERATRECL